jgi:arylsulfatase A-like enzyme
MDGLKAIGASENTIIVYVSDHGDVLGNHNEEIVQKYIETNRNVNNTLRTKGKPFSTAFRIPLIISGPGMQERGITTEAWLISVDLAPTIVDLAGITVPRYMQGKVMAGWYRKWKGPCQPYLDPGERFGMASIYFPSWTISCCTIINQTPMS